VQAQAQAQVQAQVRAAAGRILGRAAVRELQAVWAWALRYKTQRAGGTLDARFRCANSGAAIGAMCGVASCAGLQRGKGRRSLLLVLP
jgi:hypothetical protein